MRLHPISSPAAAALLLLAAALAMLAAIPRGVRSAPPDNLANFQDEYPCNNVTVRIVRQVKGLLEAEKAAS